MRTTTRRLFDPLVRDVRYACRGVRGAPLVALTLVMTIGLGLGLLAAVFTVLNGVVFRPDDVRNPQELFAVARQPSADAEVERFTREQYDALVRETSVFTDAFATASDVDRWIDGQRMEGALVTGNFFQVLGASAARGRTLTPSDDSAASRVIVLSHRAWTRYFASDPAIAGRTVRLNDAQFDVLGVMPENFRGLTFAPPDFWAPLSLRDEFRRNAGESQAFLGIVGRLRPGVSSAQALAQLAAWDTQRSLAASGEPPARSLLLEPRQGTVPLSAGTIAAFVPLFFAFGLILLIGCANVANLLLARGISRQREVGIRLALGASRRRIVVQLFIESLLLAIVAAAVGFGLSRIVLHAIVYYLTTALTNLGDVRLAVPPADWRVGLFLVVAAIVSTLLFALAPALRSTRFDLVRAIHGEVLADARPGRVRSGLIALQVTASVLLLVCSAIFLRSSWEAASVDPGVRTADTVFLGIGNEPGREAIVDAVRNDPSVTSIAAMSPVALDARAETATGASTATYRFVSPEYFDILGVNLARGRGFTPAERDAIAGVTIVSQSAAQALWPDRDALGQELRLEPPNDEIGGPAPAPLPASTFVVVGIVEDVAGFRQGGTTLLAGPGVYLPTTPEAPYTGLTLRVLGDPDAVARRLRERLSTVDPNVGEIIPLRELTRMEATLLAIPFWLTLVLGGLALFLTLSGLFSVLSYLIEQRTREIGVRIALGATPGRISALVLSQSIRPVGIGLVLGTSLVAALGAALLATPAAELIGSSVRLFDPVAYAAGLLFVAAACGCAALAPVRRAMRVDPITALRQD